MSDAQDTTEWVWQGFFGPMAIAVEAKQAVDEDARAGVWVPMPGEPPAMMDSDGVMGMFAVQTRRSSPIAVPKGLFAAHPLLVGRMVGA